MTIFPNDRTKPGSKEKGADTYFMQDYIFSNDFSRNIDAMIYTCGYENCAPGHSYGPILRNGYLIHYILNGSGIYKARGKIFRLKEGDAFLISQIMEIPGFFNACANGKLLSAGIFSACIFISPCISGSDSGAGRIPYPVEPCQDAGTSAGSPSASAMPFSPATGSVSASASDEAASVSCVGTASVSAFWAAASAS